MEINYDPTPPRRKNLSNRILVCCLLILAGILFWQNLIWPTWQGIGVAKPAIVVPRGDLAEDEKSTIELFNRASPSVVNITTLVVKRDYLSFNVLEIPQGTGTGFAWDNLGHIVTNFHVIENADTVNVTLADQSTWKAKIVGVAPDMDLAVLKINSLANRLQPLPVGTSSDLQVGQKVFAIGNPFGLDQSLTMGLISAVGREIKSRTSRRIENVIQTDAAINPGNSGGPLLDSAGRLIGVNTAIAGPTGVFSGIGFATPVDSVNWVVPELIAHGRIIRPGLAITIAPEIFSQRWDIDGVLVLAVKPNSTVANKLRATKRDFRGNIYLGDIITAVDDSPVTSPNDLLAAFEQHEVGDQVTLSIIRGKKKQRIEVELEAQ